MKFGRTRFYADENIEAQLVELLRGEKYHVDYSLELGLSPLDDSFHFEEARRRGAVLLSRDPDFLDDKRFPWSRMGGAGVVVPRTDPSQESFAEALACLMEHIAPSGTTNLLGLKIGISGPRMTVAARIRGAVRREVVSLDDPDRELFTEDLAIESSCRLSLSVPSASTLAGWGSARRYGSISMAPDDRIGSPSGHSTVEDELETSR